MTKLLLVCGARPNFMKVAPIAEVCARRADATSFIVHTGQHYDANMSRLFFDELALPEPDVNLEVGSASHAVQTAEIMKRFEPVCLETRPDWVVVVGDVNSTIACALVARKLGVPVAHVEAGLRSFDRAMPEEINRVLTDTISDMLFVTEESGMRNLSNEGIPEDRIRYVGNVMIDTLLRHRERADRSRIRSKLGVEKRGYALVTLHRPSNVDDADTFNGILDALERICADSAVVFPMHPRTRARVEQLGFTDRIGGIENLRVIEPVGYLDFVKLMADAMVVLTDSGGIQEETTILGVPCLTLRENTERPVTVTHGTNRLTGPATKNILAAYDAVRAAPPAAVAAPHLWDGKAAERIVDALCGT